MNKLDEVETYATRLLDHGPAAKEKGKAILRRMHLAAPGQPCSALSRFSSLLLLPLRPLVSLHIRGTCSDKNGMRQYRENVENRRATMFAAFEQCGSRPQSVFKCVVQISNV